MPDELLAIKQSDTLIIKAMETAVYGSELAPIEISITAQSDDIIIVKQADDITIIE